MRAKEFNFSDPVEELENRLPKLKKIDYDSIDEVMQKICNKHKLTGKKLHDMFVKKHGHTPDYWVKQLKKKLGEEDKVNEAVEGDSTKMDSQISDFVKWSYRRLHMKEPYPKITLSDDTAKAQEGTHTGLHTEDGHIWVYTGNRNLIDIFRTIFHELVHHRQSQLGMIGPDDSYPGSPIEAMADMMAGKYIKIYGKHHPEIFQ